MCKTFEDLEATARAAAIRSATARVLYPSQATEAFEHHVQCKSALDAHIAQCEDNRCFLIRTMRTPEAQEAHEAQCETNGCRCRIVRDMCLHGIQIQQRHPA